MKASSPMSNGVGALPAIPLLILVYAAAVAGAYWTNFVWFYLDDRWHASPAVNLLINAGFGLCYFSGCLTIARLGRRFAPRAILIAGYVGLIGLTAIAALVDRLAGMALVNLVHAFMIAWTWPTLEVLVTRGHRGVSLGRAVGRYNIAWALMSFVAYAVSGRLYEQTHLSFFAVPTTFWLVAVSWMLARPSQFQDRRIVGGPAARPTAAPGATPAEEIEPEAAGGAWMRDLSRLANLGSYVIVSTLLPILPAVTRGLGLGTAQATLFGSLWMAARVMAFVALGRWHGWHYRRAWFLGAIAALPVCFLTLVFCGSVWVAGLAAVGLGALLGFVYSSALFYSLNAPSLAHQAAYHEAAIGAGMMLGPLVGGGAGFLAERWGLEQLEGVAGAVIVVLLVLAGLFGLRGRWAR